MSAPSVAVGRGTWSIGTPASIFELDSFSSTNLRDAALRLAKEFNESSLDDHDLLVRIELETRSLTPELLAELVGFRLAGSADGMLLIRGVPVDEELPPTPADGAFQAPWHTMPVSTISQLMLLSVLGDVISYADEKGGSLIQDVCPVAGAEQAQENTGSCLLELHTEDGFHPNKPHFVSLLGLRSDHEQRAATVAAGIRRAYPNLSAEHAAILREPQFRIRLASSFTGPDGVAFSEPLPVLSGSLHDPDLCVDFHAMQPLTDAAREAFDALRDHMLDVLVGVILQPGDLLVVDNRKAVHGRTGFVPRHDGVDRWLRRCFVISDIRTAHPQLLPNSRVHRPITEPV